MPQLFENTKTAFALKSDAELERAYFLFKLIANQPLVRIGTAVTNFAIKTHLPVEGLIRATVFDHFCAGISKKDCMPTVDKLWQAGVSSVLDYSIEGKDTEDPLDDALEMTLKILDFVREKEAIPFAVFKPTGYGRFYLYEKIGAGKKLTRAEQEEWGRVVGRYEASCKKAYDLDVSLLIDAEETWMQDAADELVEEMMRKYNRKKAVVFNTIQLYRWDRLDYLKGLVERAERDGFKVGIKIVRGAYLEKENERAEEMGYKSPICASKKETDDNFNKTAAYILDHLDVISVYVGTHNEESSYLLMQMMEERHIDRKDPRIWFGQLFGMSDHITFNMAAEGYNVTKYLPFGPVRDVMPYLIRRAEENTSVAGQTNRELELLKKERKRRKI
ncbi:L-proline dehydrogenase [Muriicola jejuensis]|uniref:Proline dehydrogenase n=1 Tax=Muriicola jejuensis TaxID=504488 RepID=A0A6P0UD59_9FLAO|nr:proline dehydrogenase family protein [Muriicola jejuensis]NER11211.1 proline dehydrogenase [Muriicola jejuensis]SMP24267.1 L-proline dehydrogenase [Muriicola jejuensis]